MPTFAAEHGVSQGVVREALLYLEGLGWVVGRNRARLRYEVSRPWIARPAIATARVAPSDAAELDEPQPQAASTRPNKWSEAADRLRQRCREGSPGDRLEPTRELARMYGVSRATMTHSVMVRLLAEGWVALKGKRYVIAHPEARDPEH